MINMRKHLGSRAEFANWLSTMFVFYLVNRLVNFEDGIQYLPDIQSAGLRSSKTDEIISYASGHG